MLPLKVYTFAHALGHLANYCLAMRNTGKRLRAKTGVAVCFGLNSHVPECKITKHPKALPWGAAGTRSTE
jgi:hypothetical protein